MASEDAHLENLCNNETHESAFEHLLTFLMEEMDYTEAALNAQFDSELLEVEMSLLEAELNAFDTFMDLDCRDENFIVGGNSVPLMELSSDLNQEEQHSMIVAGGHSRLQGLSRLQEKTVIDLLMLGAGAVEAENWSQASKVTMELNSLLDQENEDPFYRLAFFFTRGLHYKSANVPEVSLYEHAPREGDFTAMFQILLELSPYVKFAHFTANQAILEIIQGKDVHAIDFDIMHGIKWPPLMVDLVLKETSLRITAVIGDPKETGMIGQTGNRLKEFADSIDLPFRFDQIVLEKEEDFKGIEVGDILVVKCMVHQFCSLDRNLSLVKCLLSGVSNLCPKMVVLVEEELFNSSRMHSKSFVDT